MASIITKLKNSIEEHKDIENAMAEAERVKAMFDYNIMMGNIEDPSEEDEEDE